MSPKKAVVFLVLSTFFRAKASRKPELSMLYYIMHIVSISRDQMNPTGTKPVKLTKKVSDWKTIPSTH